MLAAVPTSTPQIREAILAALFARRDRLPSVVEALEAKQFSLGLLSALQRAALLEHDDPAVRRLAERDSSAAARR